MKYFHLTLIFFLIGLSAVAQKAHQLTTLSDDMRETSGLLYVKGAFYTFNDSGGEPELYQIDTVSGDVSKTIVVKDAENEDWEAITADDEFIYIGDIGNNKGKRKDLVIYKCPIEGLKEGKLLAKPIWISYRDQESFDQKKHHHEYDAEALFVRDDKLYLVSKNWVKDESKIYEVPKEPGSYVLKKEATIPVFGKVTDAFYDVQQKGLFLIGYGAFPFITYLKGFDGTGAQVEISLPINSPNGFQTEGITFVNNTIFYTSEEVQVFKAELARFFLSDFEELVNVEVKGSRFKLKSDVSIESIVVSTADGKLLYEEEGVNKKSKTLSIKESDAKGVIYLIVAFESGALYRQRISF